MNSLFLTFNSQKVQSGTVIKDWKSFLKRLYDLFRMHLLSYFKPNMK